MCALSVEGRLLSECIAIVEARMSNAMLVDGFTKVLERISQEIGNVQIALSAFTIAELTHGIRRADSVERRERRRMFLAETLGISKKFQIFAWCGSKIFSC